MTGRGVMIPFFAGVGIGIIAIKAGKDRDNVLVEPGSRRFFGSVSVSERRFLGILCSKDTF